MPAGDASNSGSVTGYGAIGRERAGEFPVLLQTIVSFSKGCISLLNLSQHLIECRDQNRDLIALRGRRGPN
jgi:hypothetical protein